MIGGTTTGGTGAVGAASGFGMGLGMTGTAVFVSGAGTGIAAAGGAATSFLGPKLSGRSRGIGTGASVSFVLADIVVGFSGTAGGVCAWAGATGLISTAGFAGKTGADGETGADGALVS
ncbi:MAG: hypothetical protein ABIN69_04855 [Aestuariivirga sp.]